MKKSLIILILSVVAMCLPAQAEHLKFMGIPLTGTITQFQQKLTAKGVSYNKRMSDAAPVGTRWFSGTFAGTEADIIVWYDPSTKNVFGAKAVYECATTSMRDNKYEDLKSMLQTKYAEESAETSYKDGLEKLTIPVTDDYGYSLVGMIVLYRNESDSYYDKSYYVHVEYLDAENYDKHQNRNMDDL